MQSAKKVAFYTLGCKLNYAETSSISRRVEAAGFEILPFEEKADIYVINTCSVTDNADKKCRNIVRRARKQNQDSNIVVIGCYAQLKPQEIADIKGVDLVLGAAEKFNLASHLKTIHSQPCSTVIATPIGDVNTFSDAYSAGDRTRTFLKIQDGCDYKCSFCTIPLARGKSRSDNLKNIITNVENIGAQGIKEIVLTGVNIGDYGKGLEDDIEFFDVVKAIDKLDCGIERVRISSIEPNLLKDEIIEFVAGSRLFMPHFHVPLQSGNNKILTSMRRRYRRELYTDRVDKIKKMMPHACIGADVIVGFPGETEIHFLDTFEFIKNLDVSYLHVFTYSERNNTLAVQFDQTVDMGERYKRNEMLRILSEKKRISFYEQHIGTERVVLWEHENKDGEMFGYTDNYIKVVKQHDESDVNKLSPCLLKSLNKEGIVEVG
jgi:threonylcarbamoyladenosine tRNA methylthiotransferase MtaB